MNNNRGRSSICLRSKDNRSRVNINTSTRFFVKNNPLPGLPRDIAILKTASI
ncbi:hypothetical protein Syun_001579 [Stephania yunnanensis]|uniref:Uncharacterized protein n=1 Tax=Stephania yunnanensis TaxID=152371 RepID=A0AAP0LI39_9MAGN